MNASATDAVATEIGATTSGASGDTEETMSTDHHHHHHHHHLLTQLPLSAATSSIQRDLELARQGIPSSRIRTATATDVDSGGGGGGGKRNKREWLAFHGQRHSRVGAEYQVDLPSLPLPPPPTSSRPTLPTTNEEKGGDAMEEKNDVATATTETSEGMETGEGAPNDKEEDGGAAS